MRRKTAIALAIGYDIDQAFEALDAAEGDAKVAIVSLLRGVDAETARAKLSGANGNVRQALAR